MSWPPLETLPPVDLAHLGDLKPLEVLYDFDGPCIFTARTPAGLLLLAYLVEELDPEAMARFLVATSSHQTLDGLREGALSVRAALLGGSLWLVDVGQSDALPKRAYQIEAAQLPPDALPAPATMLLPELEPLLHIRLCGDRIRPGAVPAPALAQVAEIAKTALKPIYEWLARNLRGDQQGRPPEWLRDLYTLNVQAIGQGSLDVFLQALPATPGAAASTPPEPDQAVDREDMRIRGWSLLKKGLDWSASPAEGGGDLGEATAAIMESLRRLAPPTTATGPVTHIEVSGSMLGHPRQPYRLTQQTAKRIRTLLTTINKGQDIRLKVFEGRIRSLDLDLLTLTLRNAKAEPAEVSLTLDDDTFYEAARDAHYHELGVRVAARSLDAKTWTLVDLEFSPHLDQAVE